MKATSNFCRPKNWSNRISPNSIKFWSFFDHLWWKWLIPWKIICCITKYPTWSWAWQSFCWWVFWLIEQNLFKVQWMSENGTFRLKNQMNFRSVFERSDFRCLGPIEQLGTKTSSKLVLCLTNQTISFGFRSSSELSGNGTLFRMSVIWSFGFRTYTVNFKITIVIN